MDDSCESSRVDASHEYWTFLFYVQNSNKALKQQLAGLTERAAFLEQEVESYQRRLESMVSEIRTRKQQPLFSNTTRRRVATPSLR